MTKKHIIFDLDGTLSNTAKATMIAITEAEKQLKLPKVTEDQIRDAMGLAGLAFYEYLYPQVSQEVLLDIENIVDAAEEVAVKTIGKEILFPGVVDMLMGLLEKGCFIYIASTGSKNHVYNALSACNIEKFFTEVSCGESEKILMVRRIIAGRNLNEWAMVGDMFKDSEAARGNKILALGAGYGYLTKSNFPLFDFVLSTPMDIFNY